MYDKPDITLRFNIIYSIGIILHLYCFSFYDHLTASALNRYSQFRTEYSLEEIEQSPTVFGPITKLQCCPTSDGGAAAVLASEQFVIENGLQEQAVEILGMEMATDTNSTFDDNNPMKLVSN